MAVYVDRPAWKRGKKMSCHMLADTRAELHAMAAAIGCHRRWYEISRTGVPHYDLHENERATAILHGAVEITRRETAVIMERTRLSGYGNAK